MEYKVTMAGARVSAGLTQVEMAEKMGVSQVSVANWESGKVVPSVLNFRKFCEIAGVPEQVVFFERA